ncbi:zinc finger protein 235 [Anabrus simplex]|uniref:zinc finger protein 235 n=1 Tax=Anabrus simplex TaxID=316456 RepID=UPI0035A30E5E
MENGSGSDPVHHPEVAGIHGTTLQFATDQTVRVVPTAQLMSPSAEGTGVQVGWGGALLQFNSMPQEGKSEINNTENPLAFEEICIKPEDVKMSGSPNPLSEDISSQEGIAVDTVPACDNGIPSEQPDDFKELGQLATFLRNSLSSEEHSRFENPVESNAGHERLLHELVENNLNTNHGVSKVEEGVQNNTFHEDKQQGLVSFEKEFISFIGKESVDPAPAAQSSGVAGRFVGIGDTLDKQDSNSAENESPCSGGSQGSSSEPFLLGANWTVGRDGRRFTSCPICSRTFYKMHGLAAHYAAHTAPKSFPCSSCDKRFSTAAYLKAHMVVHTGKKEAQPRKPQKNFGKWFGCMKCSIGFTASSGLKKHRCGPESAIASCSGCGRVYKGSGALSLHMRFHCPLTKTKVCDLCGKCFDCPEKLTKHRKRHSGSHPYSCLACSSWFKSREGVNKHSVQHAVKQQELSSNPQSDN